MPLRLVFMGTPAFAVPTLSALHTTGHDIAAVYTQPPRPGGRRGLDLVKSPVHLEAEKRGLPVRTPASLRSADEQEAFASLEADAAVVVAYGLILPRAVLDAPRLGCWNGHASALPRWRGAAPIQRAIMAGDTETAMMVMRMEVGLDTGPIALARTVPIGPETTGGELHDRLSEVGADLMVRAMDRLERAELHTTAQSADGVTYASKIDKAETRLDWSGDAQVLHDRIRALSPAPGAWSELSTGGTAERLKILRTRVASGRAPAGTLLDGGTTVACGSGALTLVEVQRAGGKPITGQAFANGLANREASFR